MSATEPIAIVGMAGRFPSAADIDEFWDNLAAGRDVRQADRSIIAASNHTGTVRAEREVGQGSFAGLESCGRFSSLAAIPHLDDSPCADG